MTKYLNGTSCEIEQTSDNIQSTVSFEVDGLLSSFDKFCFLWHENNRSQQLYNDINGTMLVLNIAFIMLQADQP